MLSLSVVQAEAKSAQHHHYYQHHPKDLQPEYLSTAATGGSMQETVRGFRSQLAVCLFLSWTGVTEAQRIFGFDKT